jgi:hypothetical protein
MKTTKTTIAATIALTTLVGTQLYAQNTKIDNITLSMTLLAQNSVSTSGSSANAGNFSQGPKFYKTISTKLTQGGVLKAIAAVLHPTNPNFYSANAQLQLVQGELGGFWNINDGLAQSFPDYNTDGSLTGTFNDDGLDSSNPYYSNLESTFFPTTLYGFDPLGKFNFSDVIENTVDTSPRTSLSGAVNEYVRLDTGRHFLPVPWQAYGVAGGSNGIPYVTTGEYPVGHMQPWGQIFIKDPGHKDSAGNPLCENVTYFFDFEVAECYDCFYLSSFVSDATFKIQTSTPPPNGPPCCTGPSGGILTGQGTDRYYMSVDFDNTVNNSFLNPSTQVNSSETTTYTYNYVGVTGLTPTAGVADGLTPDLLPYSDSIKSGLGSPSPYETRFSLKGVVVYNWTLKKINSADVAADFIGKATYTANGYGFVGLVCDLIPSATMTFQETSVKDTGCCDDAPWYTTDNQANSTGGWYGPGWDGNWGYFNPNFDQYNPYPFYNIVGGFSYDSDTTVNDLPYQFESPYNPAAALTRHHETPGSSSIIIYNFNAYTLQPAD